MYVHVHVRTRTVSFCSCRSLQDIKETLDSLQPSVTSAQSEHSHVISGATPEEAAEIQELVQNISSEWQAIGTLNEHVTK